MNGKLQFDDRGLIPAVLQSRRDGRVLMVAYMNRESLDKTLETGEAHFWSRSRREIWRKGETSGNVMKVVAIRADCDADCLLLHVEPAGPACHTGEVSCFFDTLLSRERSPMVSLSEMMDELAVVIRERKRLRPAGSYTSKLFEGGVERIAKKVGEEAVEVAVAGMKGDTGELARESADLIYHLLVLWEELGVESADVAAELEKRRRAGGERPPP